MSSLVIIGARAMGRETFAYATDCGISVKGFLDSDSHALDGFEGYPPILESVESYDPSSDDVFACALGDPAQKMKYVNIVRSKGGKFISIVHPTAYVGKNVKIGNGCIVCPHSSITNDTTLQDHVIVNVNASLSHDGVYGEGSTISPGCNIAGRCSVGARSFVGIGAVLIPDVALGEGVVVAAGSVVTKPFSEKVLVAGVPAVVKKNVS